MSKNAFRRKTIRPVIDRDELDDEYRRDTFGRKRVDVIQCLLESSDDSSEDSPMHDQSSHQILWVTFAEICHIRTVLAQTTLSTLLFNHDKQHSKIVNGDICFRCRKSMHSFFSLSSFFSSTNAFSCYICQQKFCRKCSVPNFLPPLLRHSFPVRLQTLIQTTNNTIDEETTKENEPDQQRKTICYDCAQVRRRRR